MKANKTQPTSVSAGEYLAGVENEQRRADAKQLVEIMQEITGEKPVMWGPSIVGFGHHHYKYASGREGDICKIGFAARNPALVLYGINLYDQIKKNNDLLPKLGPHSQSKGCLYIKSLADIDLNVLKQMIVNGFEHEYVY